MKKILLTLALLAGLVAGSLGQFIGIGIRVGGNIPSTTGDTTPPDSATSASAAGYSFYQLITTVIGFDTEADTFVLKARAGSYPTITTGTLLVATGDTAAVSDTFNFYTATDSLLVYLSLYSGDTIPNWTAVANRFVTYVYQDNLAPDTISVYAITSTKDDTLTVSSSGYPLDGDSIRVVAKAGSAPSGRTDGTLLYAGSDSSAVDGDYKVTQSDTTNWYVKAFINDSLNNWNTGNLDIITVNSYNSEPYATDVSHTGSLAQGSVRTGAYTYNDDEGDSESGTTHKWYRADDAIGTGITELDSAGTTYTLQLADYTKYIAYAPTVAAAEGPSPGDSVLSSFLGPITNQVPTASSVSVSGSTVIDSTLTINYTYGDTESDAEGTSTFKWYRNGVELDSTRQYYILSSADSAYYLRGSVTPIALTGNTTGAETLADSVGPVTGNTIPVASSVSISGFAYEGYTLTGNYTYADAESDAEGATTFKWFRNGVETDSTRQYYILSSADSSYYLTFKITPVAATGWSPGAEVASDSVGPVTDAPVVVYDVTNWYVDSQSGNDGNSGHHPDSAFATLSAIEGETINAGDTIYLVAGSVWRETLDINESGSSGNLITFLKYSSGDNPKILGSNQATTWTETGTENVWETATSLTDNSTEYYPGRVFFVDANDSAAWGTYYTYNDLSELTQEFDYTVNGTTHYVYSTTDPDVAYTSVEVTQRQYCVNIGSTYSYHEFNGIDIKYARQRGIWTGYPATRGQTDFVVRNCNIGYIGGKSSGSAHGIEVFSSNVLIENSNFSDCGRRAISFNTYTSPEGGRYIRNLIVRNNTFKRGYHTTSMDLSVMNQTGDTVRGVYFYHNIIDDSEILAGDIAGNPSNQVFIQEGDSAAYLFDSIYIVGNVFAKAQTRWINFDDTYGGITAHIYQNTFAGFNLGRTGSPYGGVSLNDLDSLVLYNNVFYDNFGDNAIENNMVHGYNSPLTGYNKDYNLYWSLYPGNDRNFMSIDVGAAHYYYDITEWETYKTAFPTHEANSPTPADPCFKDFTNGDYTLEDTSDAVSAGDVIDYIIITDLFGVVDTINKYDINDSILSRTAPDLGAYQTQQDTANSAPVISGVSVTGETNIDSVLTFNYTYSDIDSDAEDTTYVNWWSNGIHIGTGHTYTTQQTDSGNYVYAWGTPHSATGIWASPGDSVRADSVGPITRYVVIDTIQTFSADYTAVQDSFDIVAVGFDALADTVVGQYKLGSYPTSRSDGTNFYAGDTSGLNGVRFFYDAAQDTALYVAVYSGSSLYGEWSASANQDTVKVDSTGIATPQQNLVLYSEQIDNAAWVEQETSTKNANQANDCDGELTMEEVVHSVSGKIRLYQTVNSNISANTTYTISFEVYSAGGWGGGACYIKVDNLPSYAQLIYVDISGSMGSSCARVSAEFTTSATCTGVNVFIFYDTYTNNDDIYIGRVHLYEGNIGDKAYITTTSSQEP